MPALRFGIVHQSSAEGDNYPILRDNTGTSQFKRLPGSVPGGPGPFTRVAWYLDACNMFRTCTWRQRGKAGNIMSSC